MLKRSYTMILLVLGCVAIMVTGCAKALEPEDFHIVLEQGTWLDTGEITATKQMSEALFQMEPEEAKAADKSLEISFRLEPYGKSTQAVIDPKAKLTVAGKSYDIWIEQNQGLAVYNHRQGYVYGGQLESYIEGPEGVYPFNMTIMYWPSQNEFVASLPMQWIWLEFGDISLTREQMQSLQRVKD